MERRSPPHRVVGSEELVHAALDDLVLAGPALLDSGLEVGDPPLEARDLVAAVLLAAIEELGEDGAELLLHRRAGGFGRAADFVGETVGLTLESFDRLDVLCPFGILLAERRKAVAPDLPAEDLDAEPLGIVGLEPRDHLPELGILLLDQREEARGRG